MKNKTIFRRLTAAGAAAALCAVMMTSGTTALAATATPEGYITYRSDVAQRYPEAAEKFLNALINREAEIDLSDYYIPLDEAETFFNSVLRIRPEMFYVDSQLQYYYYQSRGQLYLYSVMPNYNCTKEQYSQKLAEFDSASEHILKKIQPGMSDFEKALIIHDELAINSSYTLSGSTYTMMVSGRGKCMDYSEAYAFLLAQVGIKSEIVDSEQMNHEWLKVCIDGIYYNVDLTFDEYSLIDPGLYEKSGETRPNGYRGSVHHDFFLLSDRKIQNMQNGPHYGYTSKHTYANGEDTRFDDAWYHRSWSQFCYVDGTLYTIDNENSQLSDTDRSLVSYDLSENKKTALAKIDSTWSAGVGMTYLNSYANLDYYGGYFYYNGSDGIYRFDPDTNKTVMIGSNPLPDEEFYGLKIYDGKIYVYTCVDAGKHFRDKYYAGDAEEKSDVLIGDTDGDGVIAIDDATTIQRHLAGMITLTGDALKAADADGSGQITIDDATAIQKYLAKMTDSLG